MSIDVCAEEIVASVEEAFALQLRKQVPELSSATVSKIANSLVKDLSTVAAGMRVTFKVQKSFKREDILASWQRGRSAEQIVQEHGCSRSTAYKFHPSKRDLTDQSRGDICER